MNKIILTILLVVLSNVICGQEMLDIAKLKDCELFPNKGKFDNSARLQEVKELKGELITVFLLKRNKKNVIKESYTGVIDYALIEKAEQEGTERPVEVIVIAEDLKNRQVMFRFPHTNMNYYRLYRTNCLKSIN